VRINDRSPLVSIASVATGSSRPGASVERSAVAPSDKVKLSDTVHELREAEAQRLAGLRERIASGEYVVDLDRLAQVLVDKDLP
jgi:anti-sigma28 factor (negative regulator of flagellin synthesis)